MVYIESSPAQTRLLPTDLRDIIPDDHICYLIEDVISQLDYGGFDDKVQGPGNPSYHPRILLKLIINGVCERVTSTRKLAKLTKENVIFRYLAEDLSPDFHTIATFRKSNPELIKSCFLETVKVAKELDMTATESEEARKISVDLVNDNPYHLKRYLNPGQFRLSNFFGNMNIKNLDMHRHEPILRCDLSNKSIAQLKKAYEIQPESYEELISLKGIGTKTMRALALISQIVHGSSASWKRPGKVQLGIWRKGRIPTACGKEIDGRDNRTPEECGVQCQA